jgi:hypothetical protein
VAAVAAEREEQQATAGADHRLYVGGGRAYYRSWIPLKALRAGRRRAAVMVVILLLPEQPVKRFFDSSVSASTA